MREIKKICLAVMLAWMPIMAQAAEDEVVIGMRAEPPGLDPTTGAAAAISQITLYNIFETLTRIDNNGKIHPYLAKSWTVSDDALRYTFELVEGATFHDGSDLDSADVKFTFERNAAKDSKNKRKAVFANMAKIETPDANTVVVTLEKVSGSLLFNLAQASAVIVAPETADSNETNPVGSGPYQFVAWTKGDRVTMEKYAGHRDAENVAIAKASFRFIKDATSQVAALLAGDIDYMPTLSAPELFVQFEAHSDFTTLTGTTEGETILAMNNRADGLADVRVRRAIAHAIDRALVIDGASGGYGVPIGTHFAPHNPDYVDLTGMYPYDPEKAKALLQEAGFNRQLKMRVPPFDYAKRSGEIIADMLRKAGVDVAYESVEWPVWLEQVYTNKQYDLTIVSHVEPMDMVIYTNADYYFQYDSQEFRDLFDKTEAASTPEERSKYLQAAQRKLAEDSVNGFLYETPKLGVARKGLQGMWSNWPAFINHVAALSWAD